MPTIGRITFSDPATTGVFPIVPDYGFGYAIDPQVATHEFLASTLTGVMREQRFKVGSGVRRFIVRRARLSKTDRDALVTFWEARHTSGATPTFSLFTYNLPSETGAGTSAVTVRFAREPLSLDSLMDTLVSTGITLIEVPTAIPSHSVSATVDRFPSVGFETTLAGQQHEFIPLIKIRVKESAVSDILLSNRRVTVAGLTYEPRLVSWSGIRQGIGGENDESRFVFGNADRVMSQVAADTLMRRARVTFSLYHVASQTMVNLWQGDISDHQFDQEGSFEITASDPIYEMTLPYPVRRVSRTCWKTFNDGVNCPYSTAGSGGNPSFCDKTFNGPEGCQSHSMVSYFGGHFVSTQSAQIKDNQTGTWGMGRSSITATSITNPSAYAMTVPEVYTDIEIEVKALIISGREESEFYDALGIVSEGPIGQYATDASDLPKHTLDGQYNHGREAYINNSSKYAQRYFGLTLSLGATPNTTPFAVGGTGAERADGTAFISLKRTDPKGIQLSRPSDHDLRGFLNQGMLGWTWTNPTTPVFALLTNPIWVAVNSIMRARGIRLPSGTSSGTVQTAAAAIIDLVSAVDTAALCNTTVNKLVGAGTESQYKFIGIISEEKPLKDWLQEILNNCLGYYTFVNGRVRFGMRADTVSTNAFTSGNMIAGSLQVQSAEPSFNHLTVQFANSDLKWQGDTVTIYDVDHAAKIGSVAAPYFIKSQMNLVGTCTRSQAARIGTIRLREELGGINDAEWKRSRTVRFKTTILALDVEPGDIISITDADIPTGWAEFRVLGWAMNEDFSIDIEARQVTDSMYDLLVGRTGTDVVPAAINNFPTVVAIPGDVKSVTAGTPTLVTDSRGLQWYDTVITYNPPDTFQVFNGVHCWTVRDGVILDLGTFDYLGDGTTVEPGRRGTATVRLAVPIGVSSEVVRVYVASRSAVYDTPLIQGVLSTSTPSTTISLGVATPIGASGAGNVTLGTITYGYTNADELVVTIPFTEPSPLGPFVSVHCWEEAVNGATWAPIDLGYFKKSPAVLQLDPVTSPVTRRFYLTSTSETAENELKRHTDPSPTPNGTVLVNPVSRVTAAEYAPLVTGQSVTVIYDDTNVAAPMYRLRHQWTAPGAPSANQSAFGGLNIYYKIFDGTTTLGSSLAANDTDTYSDWWPLFAGTHTFRVYFVSVDSGSTAKANTISDGVTPWVDVNLTWPLATRPDAAKYADNVTSFSCSNVRYALNGQGLKVLYIDAAWTNPVGTSALARWGGVTLYLSIPGEPKAFQITGPETGSTITLEFSNFPTAAQSWTFYAISQDNNGNLNTDPNAPVGGTPSSAPSVSPPTVGAAGVEYTSLVTGYAVSSPLYRTNAQGLKNLAFTVSWTKPSVATYSGVILYLITPSFTNAVQLSGLETGTNLEIVLSDFPSATESWTVYATSVDVLNQRNTYQVASTPKATFNVSPPPAGSSGVEFTSVVTSYSVSSPTYRINAQGLKNLAFTVSWVRPSVSTYGGVILYAITPSFSSALQLSGLETGTSLEVVLSDFPVSGESWTVYAVSVDVNNRQNLYQPGVTPRSIFTVNPPPAGSSGTEFTSMVTGASFNTSQVVAADGTRQRRIAATFSRPNDPTFGSTELRVYDAGSALIGSARVAGNAAAIVVPDPNSSTTYTARLVSIDINDRTNTEQFGTPNQGLSVGSASGTFDPSRIAAGTIAASVTMTSPSLVITSGSVTVNIDGSNYVKATNSSTGKYSYFSASGVYSYVTADPTRYSALLDNQLYMSYTGVRCVLQSASNGGSGSFYNSSGQPNLRFGAETGDGYLMFNQTYYGLWVNSNKKRYVGGVVQITGGSIFVATGLAGIDFCGVTEAAGGGLPDEILAAIVSGTSVQLKNRNYTTGAAGTNPYVYWFAFGNS